MSHDRKFQTSRGLHSTILLSYTRNHETRGREIAMCRIPKPNLANHASQYVQTIALDLHRVSNVDRLIAGQVLCQKPLFSRLLIESQSKAVEVSEDTVRSRCVRRLQRHVTSRHVPRLANLCSLLRPDGNCAIRKASRKDEGFFSACLHLGQR